MAILDLAATKAGLGIEGTGQDAQITALLPIAEGIIDTYAGRPLASTLDTVRVHGAAALILPRWPIVSVTTLTDLAGPTVLVEGTDFEITSTMGKLHALPYGSAFGKGRSRYEAVYTAGYASGSFPGDVQAALLEIVAGKLRSQGGLTSESDLGYSYTRAVGKDGTSPEVRLLLARYRAV